MLPHPDPRPADVRRRWSGTPRRLRRAILRRRRPLAALCVGLAVLAGLRAASDPPPAPSITVTLEAGSLPPATGDVAIPVRLPDAGAVGLLRVGDRIDLVATDPQDGTSDVVTTDVPVLALPTGGEGPESLGGPGGRIVVLGVPETAVPLVSAAAAGTFLTYAWSR